MMRPLHHEIGERFGLVPNFFRLDSSVPEITEKLWDFTRFAYLDNPLPSLFKERVAVYLSRFCEVRYCLARHVAFLTGRGRVAGDASCASQTLDAAVRLLRQPLLHGNALRPALAVCAGCEAPMVKLPASDTPRERALFACIAHLFLQTADAPAAGTALRRALGATRFDYLDVLLAFVRTSHHRTRSHPEIVFEDDVLQLLAAHEALAACVLDDAALHSEEGRSPGGNERAPDEKQLEDTELRLRVALASARMGTWRWNVHADDWAFDASLRRILGLPPGSAHTLDEFVRFIHPDDRERVAQAFRRAARNGAELEIEFRTVRMNAAIRWFSCHGEVFTAASSASEVFMTGACVDITDLKRSEEKALENEKRYHSLFDSIDEAFAVAELIDTPDTPDNGIDFRCIEANPAFATLSLLPDPVGMTLRGVIPQIEDVWIEKYVGILRSGEPIRFQEPVASLEKWYDVFASRVGGPGSSRIAVLFTDITARKQAEAALQESAHRIERQARVFDTTLSSITDFAYIFDKEGRFIYSNQALLDLLGITFEQIVGKNFRDLRYPDELAQKLQRQIRQVIESRSSLTDETPFTSPGGVPGYYEYILSPVIGNDGTVEVVAGSTRDITGRKAVELALQTSEERSRNILESITDGFLALAPDWRVTYANPQAERLLACPARELIGKVLWTSFPGLVGSEFERTYRGVARDHIASSVTAFYSDHQRWYEAHVYPASGGITVYFSDVTERVGAQTALNKARDELEMRVAARTDELQQANASLTREIAERKRAEAGRLELLQKLVNAQEEERRRISRELHDSLGQHLTALTLGLKAMASDPGPHDRAWIERLLATTVRLDEELDRLSHELRPPALDDLGLDAALQRHLSAWSDESGIKVDAQTRGIDGVRLPGTIETTVYRIAQEALTNIRKHARATRVSFIAERRNRELRIIIEDNGAGFDADEVIASRDARRLGLLGMTERAALVAGTLQIESRPAQGSTIYLSIPLDDAVMDATP